MCAAKFRGGSDDWLDDEGRGGSRARTGFKKPEHARATALPWEEANATVVEVFPNQCRVHVDQSTSGLDPLCSYRRAGVVQKGGARERTLVAVGDRVKVSVLSPDAGVVEGVCERRNKISRPAPGKQEKNIQHVIAANLDQVVIVASAMEPEFSHGLIDRFLIGAQAAGVAPLICVTKMDLYRTFTGQPQPQSQSQPQANFSEPSPVSPPDSPPDSPWSLYRELGFDLIEICAKKGEGVADLATRLMGKKVLFCGQSGVGKTSLLRVLLGREVGKIGEVSQATGKGRHTTTSTVMLGGPEGSAWMDSPGVREFGLLEILPEKLASYYPEFQSLHCQNAQCLHSGEEGCLAVSLPRYPGYLRIFESLRAGEF